VLGLNVFVANIDEVFCLVSERLDCGSDTKLECSRIQIAFVEKWVPLEVSLKITTIAPVAEHPNNLTLCKDAPEIAQNMAFDF
jgi:hypothetical protein